MKLWQKESASNISSIESKVQQFTVGSDLHWDLSLAAADVKASLAHATMLQKVGLLTTKELGQLKKGLQQIATEIKNGAFTIHPEIEDVHSQIEYDLTQNIGEVGKKIHIGRSRNDQSLVAIKLFIKTEINAIAQLTNTLFTTLIKLSNKHQKDLLPGYTHLQLAMPSSFGLWFGAYAESLSDDLELLVAAYNVANKNPLGSAAGYGTSLPIDRDITTELMQFESLNYNSVYAQMTRGKTEKTTAMALSTIAATLSKMAMDMCLYLNQHFNFVQFPNELTTGSSIMPHKKNPDVWELIRGKCNVIQSLPTQLTMLINNLPSGYHRDLQLTKETLFPHIITLKECLEMSNFMLSNIEVQKNILKDEQYKYLFTVDAVNDLALKGMPFRDAYKVISNAVSNNSFTANPNFNYTHLGSIGNLCNKQISTIFAKKIKPLL
jgi:argininosuccinate lyase